MNIVVRGGAGFYRPLQLDWCERHIIRYIIGYGNNEALLLERRVSIETLESVWNSGLNCAHL